MKKILISLLILFFSFESFSQTYTQTFIDKCSGEKKIATTTIINGNATVSFYNQVRTFSPIEVQTGVVQTWLFTTKATYEALTCPVINNPIVQQAVTNAAAQTASNAAASAASSAASTAASSAASGAASSSASSAASNSASSAATSSAASTPPPTPSTSSSTPPPASSGTSSGSSNSSSSSQSSSSSSSESKTETKTETKSETKSESKTESKSESKEESKSESKSEEKKEESKSEEKKEEKKEESKEEKKEEKKEEQKKEEKKKEKAIATNPMLLSSDLSTIESPDGRWLQSATIGVSKSSLMGDESYSANTVIMSDLKTFIVSGGYTKMDFSEGKLKAIHSYSTAFAYLNGNYMNLLGYTWIKPTPKYGVFGYNLGLINLFLKNEKDNYDYNMSSSIVAFWTKPYQYSKKLTVSPQIFTMFAPISWNTVAGTSTVNRHMGFLLGSSFDYKLSKRFGFSFNYKLSGNTSPGSPWLSNFLIGSRMVL
jgi:hypothetical protein